MGSKLPSASPANSFTVNTDFPIASNRRWAGGPVFCPAGLVVDLVVTLVVGYVCLRSINPRADKSFRGLNPTKRR